jgi:hypothetical protein
VNAQQTKLISRTTAFLLFYRRILLGNLVKTTHWHRVVSWNQRQNAYLHDRVKKGDLVYVEGAIHYRSYTAKDGTEKSLTEIALSTWPWHLLFYSVLSMVSHLLTFWLIFLFSFCIVRFIRKLPGPFSQGSAIRQQPAIRSFRTGRNRMSRTDGCQQNICGGDIRTFDVSGTYVDRHDMGAPAGIYTLKTSTKPCKKIISYCYGISKGASLVFPPL